MAKLSDLAKKLSKEYNNDNLIIKANVVPAYKRLASGMMGMDYPLYGGLPYGRLMVYAGLEHSGKAQPLDSLVLTDNGYVRMGDIVVGENVLGADGNVHKVIGVYPQGTKPVYKVSFSDGTSTLCCNEHLWTLTKLNSTLGYKKDKRGNIQWYTTELNDLIDKPLTKKGV